jgi:DNA-binding transcriptional LysR family regulator
MNAPTTPQIPLLDLDLLNTLVAIADTGTFSSAAAVVYRTPSAISMQVKKIEDLVETPIFVRDSRSVTLTDHGKFLVEHARRMLALNREAVAHFIQPDLYGVVRLGAPDDVAERFLPEMLCRFNQSHPGVTVNVMVDGSDRMLEAQKAGELDMVLVTCDASVAREGAEILFREQLVWAALEGGIAPETSPLPVSVWEDGCIWRKVALEGLEAQGREWRVAFQSAHISGQRAAILADLAVAPIPVSSIDGKIVEAPAKYRLPKLPKYALGLVMDEDAPCAIQAAADHLRASFAKRLS